MLKLSSALSLAATVTLLTVTATPGQLFSRSMVIAAPSATFDVPVTVPGGTRVRVSSGSDAMSVISDALKTGFEKEFDGTAVNVNAVGADQAVAALLNGNADLAAISRPLNATERSQGLTTKDIDRIKIAVIVDANNPFSDSLTSEQFAKIFRGEITNWSEIGGPNAAIRLIDRPDISETRLSLASYPVFQAAPFTTGANTNQIDTDNTSDILKQLGNDGISYALFEEVEDLANVRTLAMHKTLPNDARYPFSQPFSFVYKGEASPAVAAFLGYAAGTPGQTALQSVNPLAGTVEASRNTVQDAAAAADKATQGVVDAAGSATQNAIDAAGKATQGVVDAAGNAVEGAAGVAGSTVDAAGNAVESAAGVAGNAVDAAGNAVEGAAGTAGDTAATVGDVAKSVAGGTASAVRDVTDGAAGVADNVTERVTDAAGNAVNTVGDATRETSAAAGDVVDQVPAAAANQSEGDRNPMSQSRANLWWLLIIPAACLGLVAWESRRRKNNSTAYATATGPQLDVENTELGKLQQDIEDTDDLDELFGGSPADTNVATHATVAGSAAWATAKKVGGTAKDNLDRAGNNAKSGLSAIDGGIKNAGTTAKGGLEKLQNVTHQGAKSTQERLDSAASSAQKSIHKDMGRIGEGLNDGLDRASNTVQDGTDAVKNRLSNLTGKADSALQDGADVIQDSSTSVWQRMRDGVTNTANTMADKTDNLASQAKQEASHLEKKANKLGRQGLDKASDIADQFTDDKG